MTKRTADVTSKLRLTKRAVEAIISTRPSDGPRRYWDIELPGFYLQFTPAGYASYLIRYTKPDGKKGDYTIGAASRVGPDQAREIGREKLAGNILRGEDPVAIRSLRKAEAAVASERTFAAVARRYVADRKRFRAERKGYGDEYVLETNVIPMIGDMPINTITRQRMKDLILNTQATVAARNVGYSKVRNGKTSANKVHSVSKRVFEWAIDAEIISINPAAFKRLFSNVPAKRKGILTPERFRLVWTELENRRRVYPQRTPIALQLYFLTLQRPIDIARARIEDFDFTAKEWRIPGDLTKTGDPYFIPLTDVTLALVEEATARVDGDLLFPGIGTCRDKHISEATMYGRFVRAVKEIKKRGEWPDGPTMELYDFRRFGRTQLVHKLNFSKEVAERVINHAEPSGIDQLYDVHDYTQDIRDAHLAWSAEVIRMVSEGTV